ncbi:HD domain-containing protein [Candidatus Woesearchaeota archaeon]|nr:HD domain-containing protein [Candidatus Woesearchaeota archaeon]
MVVIKKDQHLSACADFIFELGNLKNVKRSGWWLLGIRDPESVSEHSLRTAQIGFILAKLEHADPFKVSVMCMIHDLHETRLNDLHKVGQRYIDFRKAELDAFRDQMDPLPANIAMEWLHLFEELQDQSSREAVIAKDADLLEVIAQSREYVEQGFRDARNWSDNAKGLLKTESARKLASALLKRDHRWWKDLKKIGRL